MVTALLDANAAFLFRLVLGVVLSFAAITKLLNLGRFSQIIWSYRLLPPTLARISAYAHPFLEFAVGALLLVGAYPFTTALAALVLMSVSTVFLVSALIQKKKMDDCGCYGGFIPIPLSWKKVAENCVWMLLSLYLLLAALYL